MRLSELTPEDVELHSRVEGDDMNLVPHMIEAAQSYVLGYTALSADEADEYPELAIAALSLVSDMLEKRSMTIDDGHVNKTVDTILGMHCRNLI